MLDKKLYIVVLDNGGFGCIDRLQRSCGDASFNNLFPSGPGVDFAGHAASPGAKSRKVASLAELEAALPEMRAERRTPVVVIATDPAASTKAGGAWWDVAVPDISDQAEVAAARAAYDAARARQLGGLNFIGNPSLQRSYCSLTNLEGGEQPQSARRQRQTGRKTCKFPIIAAARRWPRHLRLLPATACCIVAPCWDAGSPWQAS
jgi:Thiamine pyrophosphate enzyme, C-terminal TPP binding domain